jgi:hypothetical protein
VFCLYGCCVSGCFIRNKKVVKVSKVLSLALEPISKSAVHYLARRVYSERSLRSLGIGGVWLLMRLSYVSNHTYTYGLL